MKPVDLYRASSVMAIGTIISRITGFIRGDVKYEKKQGQEFLRCVL